MAVPDMFPIAPERASVRIALERVSATLGAAGVPDPSVDAELLLAHVLGVSRGGVHAAVIRGDTLASVHETLLTELVARRSKREPLQHITGEAPFRTMVLRVGPGVFVPRPETEIAAGIAIDFLRAVASPAPRAVDLGTGSGALALSLALEVPHASVWGVENSVDAFIWAKENREHVGADNARIVFDDLAHALPELDGSVDVVVSNPPYVPDDAIPRDAEVRLFDPASALYGGADGLDVVREVSATAWRLTRPGGAVVIEHGEWQGAPIREILLADGWHHARTHQDLTMRDRVTTALRPVTTEP